MFIFYSAKEGNNTRSLVGKSRQRYDMIIVSEIASRKRLSGKNSFLIGFYQVAAFNNRYVVFILHLHIERKVTLQIHTTTKSKTKK